MQIGRFGEQVLETNLHMLARSETDDGARNLAVVGNQFDELSIKRDPVLRSHEIDCNGILGW